MELAVSILGIKENLKEKIDELNKTKTSFLHIDIMDGKFVPNIHDNFVELEKSLKDNKKRVDVHLMVEDVERYVNIYKNIHPEYITFHYEISDSIHRIINIIKGNNIKVGLAIKPNTKVEEIYEFLSYIHTCLIMTVEPGKGGQKLIESTVEKVRELKKYITEKNIEIDIEVDGGINLRTAPEVKDAGANILVSGSAILMANNFKTIIDELKK